MPFIDNVVKSTKPVNVAQQIAVGVIAGYVLRHTVQSIRERRALRAARDLIASVE